MDKRVGAEPVGAGRTAEHSLTPEDEQRYRWLIDHSPLAICIHAGGRNVYVNETLVRRMGARSADELLGRRITDFVHPDSLGAVADHIAARRHEGDTTPPLQLTILPLDGTTREVEAIAIRTRWEGKPAHKVLFRNLSEQKATEAQLRLQAALVTHVSDAFIATTVTGEVTSWNPAAEAIYGRSAARTLGLPISEAVGAPLNPASIVAAGGVEHAIHRTIDGSALSMRVSVSPMSDGYVVLCADQTPLRRAEQHFQTVVHSLEGGVVVVAATGEVVSVNPAALRIMGVPDTGVDTLEFAKLATVPIYDGDGVPVRLNHRTVGQFLGTKPSAGFVFGVDRLSDGVRTWVSADWSWLDPTDPRRSPILVSFVDITERHNSHQRLEHQASHDPLTGLPNRARMLALAKEWVGGRQRRLGAVLFIDFDNFKAINDALGHYAGDTVLQVAAGRLAQALRPDDIVGRVGGDEFVALLAAPVQAVEADDLAKRLHGALAEPIAVDHQSDSTATRYVWISASVGIVTVLPDDRRGAEQILHDADLAMYQAKRTGQATSRYERAVGRKAAGRSPIGWLRALRGGGVAPDDHGA